MKTFLYKLCKDKHDSCKVIIILLFFTGFGVLQWPIMTMHNNNDWLVDYFFYFIKLFFGGSGDSDKCYYWIIIILIKEWKFSGIWWFRYFIIIT